MITAYAEGRASSPGGNQGADVLRFGPGPGAPGEGQLARVLVVAGQRAVAEVLAIRCDADPGVRVVGVATTLDAATDMLDARRPDVVVLDVDGLSPGGDEAVAAVRRARPDCRVIAVPAAAPPGAVVKYVRAGASSIVPLQADLDDLLLAIHSEASGGSRIPPDLLTEVLQALADSTARPTEAQQRIQRLSPRELEVLSLMVDGLDRPQTAARLMLSVNTVRTHTKNILAKLDVHSSLEAVSVALRAGLRPRSTKVPA